MDHNTDNQVPEQDTDTIADVIAISDLAADETIAPPATRQQMAAELAEIRKRIKLLDSRSAEVEERIRTKYARLRGSKGGGGSTKMSSRPKPETPKIAKVETETLPADDSQVSADALLTYNIKADIVRFRADALVESLLGPELTVAENYDKDAVVLNDKQLDPASNAPDAETPEEGMAVDTETPTAETVDSAPTDNETGDPKAAVKETVDEGTAPANPVCCNPTDRDTPDAETADLESTDPDAAEHSGEDNSDGSYEYVSADGEVVRRSRYRSAKAFLRLKTSKSAASLLTGLPVNEDEQVDADSVVGAVCF
ncbi:hypothetical protein QBC47DRAFT_431800 [Echria macrotheca]|uniref:Uncharacterized protein n=1 Tax=Echria macrotheca TaxID=438768 RepID=A0AAJ0B7Y2_9PEZI|nr:hypothetical protein QBC47DRAFT_431800 [Echria macrotheca]